MIAPKDFVECLSAHAIDFYVGVPDSLLKDFCAYIEDQGQKDQHIIAANEGNAIALAAGYHMSTDKVPAVYLQNSGLGNTINPLTSIMDPEVYKIPLIMIIGWRGEPGVKDEPQHIKQGRITPSQLDLLGVPYKVVQAGDNPEHIALWADSELSRTRAPVALLIRKGTFSEYKCQAKPHLKSLLKREEALAEVLELSKEASIISTTGKTSREVYELREKRKENQRDFLTVGGMGHTASIAAGVAIGNPQKKVVCIDGDGSVLMHLGALPVIGSLKLSNFTHVLLNNAAHESVGGQPTVGGQTDFQSIAIACGYNGYAMASSVEELHKAWLELSKIDGACFLEIRIAIGSRKDLGRPATHPIENKQSFMTWAKS